MRIIVKRRDGLNEAITLTPPVEIVLGDSLNQIKTADGMEHFFTVEGIYDGWAKDVSGLDWQVPADGPTQELFDKITDINKQRDVLPPEIEEG